MKTLTRLSILALGLRMGLGGPPLAWAADPELEGRIGRLERIIANQSGSELVLQMQRLQSEIQELRGLIERQGLEIERLKRQQRDQFLDLDNRLRSGSALSQPAAAETEASQPGQVAPAGKGIDKAPQSPIPPAEPLPPNASGVPALPPPETPGGDERALYMQAFKLLKERRHQEAKAAFSEFLRLYPQGQYADSARYWLAETQYLLRDYPAALSDYERLVQSHPQSAKVPGALLKIGLIYDEQQQPDRARAALERLVRDYPNTSEAQLARERLEQGGRPR